MLYEKVMALNILHISFRKHLGIVDKYKNKDKWTYISVTVAEELKSVVVSLLAADSSNEGAKKFDIIMLNIQLSLVDAAVDAENSEVKVKQIAEKLLEKASISQVKAKMPILKDIVSGLFWEKASLDRLEYTRKGIRDLVQFILGIAYA